MIDLTNMTVTVPDNFIGTTTITATSETVSIGNFSAINGNLYVYAGGDHWEKLVDDCTIGGCIKKESDDKSWDGLEELL